MATTSWTGTTGDGDWSDNNNWSGSAPVDNDTVIIGATSDDITISLPVVPLTGITLNIGPGFSGTVGASGNFLDLDGGTMTIDTSGTGLWLSGTWTTVQVLGGFGEDMVQFQGTSASDIGTLRVLGGSGKISLPTNVVIDDIEVVSALSVTLDIGNVASLDNVTMDGGKVLLGGNVATTVTARGGLLDIDGSSNTIATLEVQPAGLVIDRSSGTITTLTVYGRFDGTQNTTASKTVTNATVYEGGVIDVGNSVDNYVFTNNVISHRGLVIPPPGKTMSWA